MFSPVNAEPPFRINSANQPPRLSPWLAKPLEDLLCFPRLNALYGYVSHTATAKDFLDASLHLLNIQTRVAPEDWARIPLSGPLVVIANHPYGAIEGMILAHILYGVRAEVKVMTNYLLAQIPQLKEMCIFVDPFNTPQSAQANIRGLKEALTWLQQGQVLIIFPAGEVSHIDIRTGQVTDPAWNENVARLIRRSGAAVLPAYIHGSNGLFFHLAGLVHPRLRTVLLPRELLNKQNRAVEVRFGSALPARQMQSFATDAELTAYLRQRTYALASRETPSIKPLRTPQFQLPLPSKARTFAPIIAAQPPAVLQAEIDHLPPAQFLTESNDLAVYYAKAAQIPQLLTEIGRLREVAFRGTGEGTGKALDLDDFDPYYLHLFIWNRANQEIVGAYRLGLTDAILKSHGLKGLYTSTLYHYPAEFIAQISPAIELGRSFVRPEYQREYAPLLMLWRGLGQFVMRHPRYKIFFGPVSISNSYTSMSRELLVMFCRCSTACRNWLP
ncbi:MAG: lysophospholipid acyltransferase family protein [Anaerolineales bacterium]|nr:lysophospholipid acyltransferase family protein [Anaerolineales bacterium]